MIRLPTDRSRFPFALAVLALATVALPRGAGALSSDSEQPIYIEANQAEADDRNRITMYKGRVVITQGTLVIRGDEVTIHYDANHEMTKMVSVGDPARFKQRPDGAAEDQHSKARRMEYYPSRDLMILLGDAQSWQGRDQISAERIVYDTRNGRVKAQGGVNLQAAPDAPEESSGSRVRITIMPKKSDGGDSGQAPE